MTKAQKEAIEKIKVDMPDVDVFDCVTGKRGKWRLIGRHLPFARLYDPSDITKSVEVAWETVHHCLSRQKPVIV